MTVAFTTYDNWGNAGQDLSGMNELVTAYDEHCRVLGQSSVSSLTGGENSQDKTLFLEMQTWLEIYCTSFIDHINGPLTANGEEFLPFTKATWQAAAGLNVGDESFRRKVDKDDSFSYGKIEKGNMRGSWCFEDLQKGFSALRWTLRNGYESDIASLYPGKAYRYAYWQQIFDYAQFVAARASGFNSFMSQWDGDLTWGDDGYTPVPHGGNGWIWNWYGLYFARIEYHYAWTSAPFTDRRLTMRIQANRIRGKARIAELPAIPRESDIYLKLTTDGTNNSIGNFNDFDGIGMEENKMTKFESFSESSAIEQTQTASYIGDSKEDTALTVGITADMAESCNLLKTACSGGLPSEGCMINDSQWLLKWNFTYQN